MTKLKLPHIAPVRFANFVIEKDDKKARTTLEFPQIPSLAMLVEAAAQSSAAFRKNDKESAYLVSLKGIKLLQQPSSMSLEAVIEDQHQLDKMRYVGFEIFEQNRLIANGTLVIAVQ
jgi:hypothetical protein